MSGDRSLGIGDLPVAGPVSSTDTLAICQSPTGCFASDLSVTLRGVSQSQLAAYYQSTFAGVAPITYDSSGNIGLAIDSTLQVTAGQLGVTPTGPPITVPSAPLLGGNGSVLGSVALGTNLSLSGTFPNQTLNAAGITGGPFLPLSGGIVSGEIISSISPAQADALATIRQVNDAVGGIAEQLANYLPLAGGTVSGELLLTTAITNPIQAATKAYVDMVGGGGGIAVPNAPLLSGNGTDLGSVSLGNNLSMAGGFPGQTLNVTGFLPTGGGTLTGPLTMATSQWIQVPTVGGVAGPVIRIGEATTGFFRPAAGATADVYLDINGAPAATWGPPNTMCNLASDLSMTSHGIIGVREPVNPQDVATKNYVDTRPGGGGGITGITAGAGITVTPDPVSPTVALSMGTGGGLAVAFGGTNGTTQATARTGLGLGTIAVQNTPLGAAYGGTGVNSNTFVVNSILMATGPTNPLTVIPTGAVTTVLHGGAPPSYGAVRLDLDVSGTLPVLSGGTGTTTFNAGSLIGMGGAGAFVGVPTPLAVSTGGTGAATFTPSGALLLGNGTAAVRASQLMTQTSDTFGLQLRTAGGPAAGANAPYLDMYWASGTLGSPGPSQSGDNLGGLFAGGADSSGWSNGGECAITFFATGNWTTASHPTAIVLGTTSPGQTSAATRLAIRQGVSIDPAVDMGPSTFNTPALYANGVGASDLAISWLAGIDPNNAVIVVAQRTMTLTNVTVVIMASNAGATLQIKRGDGTNMLNIAPDLGRVPGVYQHTLAITTLAANDFLYLATTGTFTTSVAHVTVAVA